MHLLLHGSSLPSHAAHSALASFAVGHSSWCPASPPLSVALVVESLLCLPGFYTHVLILQALSYMSFICCLNLPILKIPGFFFLFLFSPEVFPRDRDLQDHGALADFAMA